MRCKRDSERLKTESVIVQDGFAIHAKDGAIIEPAHEVMEGRLLVKQDDETYTLKQSIIPLPVTVWSRR